MDDEFNDSSFDVAHWTKDDYSGLMTIVEDAVGLKLTDTSYNEISTITKAVPSSPYTIWTKIDIYGGTYDGWGRAGIVLQEGNFTQKYFLAELQITGANDHGAIPVTTEMWDNYNTPDVTEASWGQKYYSPSIWMRVRVSGVTVSVDLSTDGLSWQYAGSDDLTFTPAFIGLFITQADQTDTIVFSFFRVTASADINQVMYGRRTMVLIP